MRIYHEAPKSVFKDVQALTDGDYALVHLFEEDPAYFKLFKEAVESGREVILDNSVFELGKSFDPDKFAHWIKKLKPTWYIIPDVFGDGDKTIDEADLFLSKYPDLPGKAVGVLQGSTYGEFERCYNYFDSTSAIGMIAISFGYPYFNTTVPHPDKLISQALGRVKLIGDLLKNNVINENRPHHLLGNSLAIEGKFYREYPWIYSVDTSNPIVASIKGVQYEENLGLLTKDPQKLVELIDLPRTKIDRGLMMYNIQQYRKIWDNTSNK